MSKPSNIKEKNYKKILYLGYDIFHKEIKYLTETIYYITVNNEFENLKKDVYR